MLARNKGSAIELGVNGRGFKALVDSGATVSVMSQNVYKKSGCASKYEIEQSNIGIIKGYGDGSKEGTKVSGKVVVPIKIEGLVLYQEFLVVPCNQNPQVILGEDFLLDQGAILDYVRGILTLHDGLVTCKTLPTKCLHDRICLVRTAVETCLEPNTECIVPVKINKRKGSQADVGIGMIEPTRSLPVKFNVAGAKCAVAPENNSKCVFRLLNPYNKTTVIPKNTVVGTYSEIKNNTTKLAHCSDIPGELNSPSPSSTGEVDLGSSCVGQILNTQSESKLEGEPATDSGSDMTLMPEQEVGYIDRLLQYSSREQIETEVDDSTGPNIFVSIPEENSREKYMQIARDIGVKVCEENITAQERDDILELVGKNREVFAVATHELGCYKGYKMTIDTGDAAPVKYRYYRASPAQKREIERQIQEMLEKGIICRSTSDWLSPVILVRKSDDTWRLCIDYRGLNKVLKPIFFPLPRHNDVVDALGESKAAIFSTIDLAQAFLQTELDPATKHKSAFICHKGVYEYNRVPYGLSNSPASFGIVMSQVLRDMLYIFALVYADDVLVYSSDVGSHMVHLQKIFDQVQEAGLKLKPTKCVFAAKQVKFLGHIFSKDGVSVDKNKTKAIDTFPVPTNTTQIKSFLGLCQYYRKFDL